MSTLRLLLIAVLACLGLAGQPGDTPAPGPADSPVLVGAGDIASCRSSGDEATARLLDGIAGTIFTTGDNVYSSGTDAEFADCFRPSWGRHKARIRPSPGNHEYRTRGASGYFNYFGTTAGDASKGYYSYDLGAWHIVVINSNCSRVGGCAAGSPQEQWLRADLAAHPAVCTLAYWHHPRFSSGMHGNAPAMQPIWQALYDAGADVVVNGHDHDYERFARQTPTGKADAVRGIRQFVVGTGGKSLRRFHAIQPHSEVRSSDAYGVLKLTLRPISYKWEFVPVAGKSFTDSGSASCDATRITLPGRFEVEDYRAGGEGIGYNDTTRGNRGGKYRNDDVDIQTTSDATGSYHVAWITAGEWLAYEVTVAAGGDYAFNVRVATPYPDRRFHIEVDGINVSGPLPVPRTGGWQAWTDVSSGPISLSPGKHIVKLVADTNRFNLNYVIVERGRSSLPPRATVHELRDQAQ